MPASGGSETHPLPLPPRGCQWRRLQKAAALTFGLKLDKDGVVCPTPQVQRPRAGAGLGSAGRTGRGDAGAGPKPSLCSEAPDTLWNQGCGGGWGVSLGPWLEMWRGQAGGWDTPIS